MTHKVHELRVIEERDELNNKILKLGTFIQRSTAFQVLQEAEQELLVEQQDAMIVYRNVLDRRIALFQETV